MRYQKMMVAILVVCSAVGAAQQILNNDAIIKMHTAGLGDDIIVSTITSQQGSFVTSSDNLIVLKNAGLSDRVIGAMITKNAGLGQTTSMPTNGYQALAPDPTRTQPSPQSPIAPSPADSGAKPRVFLQSASSGNTRNASRDQAMEMSKDFEKDCPDVRISINQQMADYTILLNHIEVGLFIRDNQIQIADKSGDLISKTKEGGSIEGGVKKACGLILADWTKK